MADVENLGAGSAETPVTETSVKTDAEKPGAPTLKTLREDIQAAPNLNDAERASALAAIDALIAEVGTAALDASTLEGLRQRAGSLSQEALAAINGAVEGRLAEYTALQAVTKAMTEEKVQQAAATAETPAAKEAVAEKAEASVAKEGTDIAATLPADKEKAAESKIPAEALDTKAISTSEVADKDAAAILAKLGLKQKQEQGRSVA